MVVRIEIIDKIFAGQDSIFKAGQILTLIIIVGKSSEIFAFKYFTDSGLLIEKCNFRLLKAMAFDTFAVACILTGNFPEARISEEAFSFCQRVHEWSVSV